MTQPAVSGIAVDILLFSCIGMPVSGLRSSGYAWGFPWYVYAAVTYFPGGVGRGVGTKASPSMRSGDCSTDVEDISSRHK